MMNITLTGLAMIGAAVGIHLIFPSPTPTFPFDTGPFTPGDEAYKRAVASRAQGDPDWMVEHRMWFG